MKRFLALALAMVMMLTLFAGCKKEETPNNNNNQTNNNGNTSQPNNTDKKMRTDVIYCDGFDIVTLDPSDSNDSYSGEAFVMIYDTLVRLDEVGQPIPWLAESWDIPDTTTYVFKLHKGVKFHNGDEMKASDVVFSLERAQKNPKSKTTLERVTKIEAVDDYTVKLTTDVPFAPMLLNLAHTQTSILSEKVVTEAEANGGRYFENPIGTGVMKFVEYRPNNFLKVERFDDYWQGATRTTSVIRRVIPEESSRTIALENGEVDYINSLPSIDIKRVTENPKLKTVEMVSSNIAYLGVNTLVKPFDDVRIRQALHYAANKQSVVDVLYEGYGVPCTSILPSIMVGFDDTLNLFPFDLDKAKALMTEAGYANGFDMEIVVSSDIRSRAAQLLQQDYAKIGINIDINLMEFGAMLDYLGGKTHQAWIMSWSGATNHDMTFTNNFHSEKVGPTGNRMWYQNPEVDAMIEAARTELDWEKREPIYKQLQKKLMEESCWIPLLQQTYVAGMNAGVDGVVMYPTGTRYFTNMVVYE